MTQDKTKQFEVKLDHEQRVIRIGAEFHELKGVLICEATEEDKKRYHCGRFRTFPIVDDKWTVLEDENILCESLFCKYDECAIGKKGGYCPSGKCTSRP